MRYQDHHETTVGDCLTEIQRLEDREDKLKESVEYREALLDKVRAERYEARSALERQGNALEQALRERDEIRAELTVLWKKASEERDEARAQCSRLNRELDDRTAERDEAQRTAELQGAENSRLRENLAINGRRMDVIVRDRNQVEAELRGKLEQAERDRDEARMSRDYNIRTGMEWRDRALEAEATLNEYATVAEAVPALPVPEEAPGLSWAECVTEAETWALAGAKPYNDTEACARMAQVWVALATAKGRG